MRPRSIAVDIACAAAIVGAVIALIRLDRGATRWWLLLVVVGIGAVAVQLLAGPTRWREWRDPSLRDARLAHRDGIGLPTADPAGRRDLVVRALADKRRWQPDGRCAGTVVEAVHVGGGTDSSAHVYVVVDVERSDQTDRIATGESVQLADLTRLTGPVTVLTDTTNTRRIGIDWSITH